MRVLDGVTISHRNKGKRVVSNSKQQRKAMKRSLKMFERTFFRMG